MNNLKSLLATLVFKFGSDLFPRESWPWTVMREAIFSFGDKGKYTGLELENIFESDQTGPLGYATVAKLLDLIGSPAKAAFASRGLSRLSIADFRKDYLLILQRDCVLKQCLENLVKALGRLDDKEVETLAAILSTEDAGFLRKGVHSLRQGENKSLIEILSPMLDEYWEKRLRANIEAGLRKLAAQP